MRVCAGGCRQAESRRLLQLVKVGKAERRWTWGGRRVETRAGHLASSLGRLRSRSLHEVGNSSRHRCVSSCSSQGAPRGTWQCEAKHLRLNSTWDERVRMGRCRVRVRVRVRVLEMGRDELVLEAGRCRRGLKESRCARHVLPDGAPTRRRAKRPSSAGPRPPHPTRRPPPAPPCHPCACAPGPRCHSRNSYIPVSPRRGYTTR